MRHLDLFSGIGGFALSASWVWGDDHEIVSFCEIEPYCQRVLKKHWPDVEVVKDVTSFKHKKNVDLATAGFPCPDLSYCGPGAGLSGDRSGLFWYVIYIICMVGRPKLLLENVAALLNRGLSTVLGALATVGYDTEWHCIPASSVGAAHIRDRIWVYADTGSDRLQGSILTRDSFEKGKRKLQGGEVAGILGEGNWRDWDTKPIILGEGNGIPNWTHRLKGLGNAIVPQVVVPIMQAIKEIDNAKTQTPPQV